LTDSSNRTKVLAANFGLVFRLRNPDHNLFGQEPPNVFPNYHLYDRSIACRRIPHSAKPRVSSPDSEAAGFVENIESLDGRTGEFCCTTLWNSQSDVENYDRGLFQEVAAKLGPMMTDAPVVRNLPVENSSVHRVAAGKAA